MTPEEHRQKFEASLHNWLGANGVDFTRVSVDGIDARLDLNKLKVGMFCLIRAYGGDV